MGLRSPHKSTKRSTNLTNTCDLSFGWVDVKGLDGRPTGRLWPSNLANCCLVKASLVRTNLRGANLSGANLTGANLSGAILSDANIRKAVFTDANLSGASLPTVDDLEDD